jgi:hypothetical protein
MWPKTIETLAREFGVSAGDLRAELRQLGVPIATFAGAEVVYPQDLHAAHQRLAGGTAASTRVQHVERIRAWFTDNGCTVTPMDLGGVSARDVLRVAASRGGGAQTMIKVQVCSTLQRGGRVHFNVAMELLRRPDVEWIVMVAPVFLPGPIDFAQRRHDILKLATDEGYADKPAFPVRLKPSMNDLLLSSQERSLMENIHGSYAKWQAARQAAARAAGQGGRSRGSDQGEPAAALGDADEADEK